MVEQDGGGDGVQHERVDGKEEVCSRGEMVVDWCRELRDFDTNEILEMLMEEKRSNVKCISNKYEEDGLQ